MKRSARFLGLIGAIALTCSIIVLFVFDHTPWPWGAGTLPGGMSDAGAESPFDRTMWWQAGVLVSTVGVGFAGALFLFAGGVMYLVFKFRPKTRFK